MHYFYEYIDIQTLLTIKYISDVHELSSISQNHFPNEFITAFEI